MIEFIALLGAIVTKLTTSTDDLVWLPKLLEDEDSTHRNFIGIVYILALSIVVFVAYLFSYLALEVFFGAYVGWFSVISSLSLIGYGIYLYKNQDDENDDFAEDKSYKPLQEKLKTAFIVSLIGSFDELAVFVVLFATNKVTIFPLLVGTIIAGILVFWISNQASQINPIKEKLAKIPEGWIIIGAGILALVLGFI